MNSQPCLPAGFARSALLLSYLFVAIASGPVASARGASADAVGRKFASPEEAVRALATAVNHRDTNALAAIFGPAFSEIESPDPVQRANELASFAAGLNASNHLNRLQSGRCFLETGADRWPFPIPIARQGESWFFDTEAGKQELINRRIGRNELQALQSLRAGAEAQREYAAGDRDGDEVLEFAQHIVSSPGAKDGLYWSPDLNGEISPLGPAFARAQSEGYFKQAPQQNVPQPFHGYFFKMLIRQGKHAPGGKYDYIINGNMIGGFALVAWPADYGDSGVMTFIINQQGKVYQKDLGPDTAATVATIKAYDPDPNWILSPD